MVKPSESWISQCESRCQGLCSPEPPVFRKIHILRHGTGLLVLSPGVSTRPGKSARFEQKTSRWVGLFGGTLFGISTRNRKEPRNGFSSLHRMRMGDGNKNPRPLGEIAHRFRSRVWSCGALGSGDQRTNSQLNLTIPRLPSAE